MSSQPSQPSGAGESGDGSGDGSGSSRGHQAMQKLKQGARLVRKKSRDSFSEFGQRFKGGARRIFGRQHHGDDAPPVPSVPTLAAPSDLGPENVPSFQVSSMPPSQPASQPPSNPPSQPPTVKASVQFSLPHDTILTARSASPGTTAQRHLSATTFATTSSDLSSQAPSSDVGRTSLQPPPRPTAGGPSAMSGPSAGDNPATGASSASLGPGVRVSAFGVNADTAAVLTAAGSAEGSRSKSPAIPEEQSNE